MQLTLDHDLMPLGAYRRGRILLNQNLQLGEIPKASSQP